MAEIRQTTYTGAPTDGTGNVNDISIDGDGVVWRCTADGKPGTWVSKAAGTFAGGIATVPPTVTTPTMATSATAVTNSTGHDCMVYVSSGTVTVIAVGGTTTGLTSGSFYVANGSTIAITYSVAPTWHWLAV